MARAASHPGVAVGPAGHEEDGAGVSAGADEAADLDAVGRRHHHVEDDEVEAAALELREPFGPGLERDHLELVAVELVRQEPAVERLIVDEQHARAHVAPRIVGPTHPPWEG